MKTILRTYSILFFSIFTLATQSCKKEAANTIINASSQENSTAKIKRLVLQPGPADGIDTWLTWQRGDDVLPNTNWDTVNITAAYAWTNRGTPIRGRSLIKFQGLSTIPSNAVVIAARLYMYGVESSIHLPAGNSIYPGSPYFLDNSMTVLKVAEDWNATTATWNNQPKVSLDDTITIPQSTSQWNYDAQADVTSIVSKWIADPSTNYGFMFRMAVEQAYKCMQFSSSNYSIAKRRPKLVVIYK